MTGRQSTPSASSAARDRLVSFSLLVSVGVIFPLLFTMNKIAIDAGTPPVAFTFWQILGAGLVFVVIGALRGELPKLSRTYLRAYFAVGITGIVGPIALLTWLADKLPTGLLSIVVILSPPLTYVIALSLGLERLRPLAVIGILCGLGGVLLLVIPEVSLPEPGMVWWFLLALVAPALFALSNNLAAILRPPEAPAVSFATGFVFAAVLLLLPVMLGLDQAYLFTAPTVWHDLTVLGAAAISCLMYLSFPIIVGLAGPVFFSQFNYIVVVAGLGWGVLLFDERHSFYVWIAAALMMIGLALVTRRAAIGRDRAGEVREASGRAGRSGAVD